MIDFCTKCLEKESEIELLRKHHYEEVSELKKQIQKLENEVDSLSLDVAFFDGKITNLSCDGK